MHMRFVGYRSGVILCRSLSTEASAIPGTGEPVFRQPARRGSSCGGLRKVHTCSKATCLGPIEVRRLERLLMAILWPCSGGGGAVEDKGGGKGRETHSVDVYTTECLSACENGWGRAWPILKSDYSIRAVISGRLNKLYELTQWFSIEVTRRSV